jgi:ribonuclease P protein component
MDNTLDAPVGKLRIESLSRQGDFSRIYAKGKRYRTPLLTAVVHRDESLETVRAAYVVSKKVAKQAVRRNLVRRRLREALRLLLPADVRPVDIVLIAHREAVAADYWQLQATLHGILTRMGLTPAQQPGRQPQER